MLYVHIFVYIYIYIYIYIYTLYLCSSLFKNFVNTVYCHIYIIYSVKLLTLQIGSISAFALNNNFTVPLWPLAAARYSAVDCSYKIGARVIT